MPLIGFREKFRLFPFRSRMGRIARECPAATLPHLLVRWFSCPFELLEPHIPRQGILCDLGCGHGLMLHRLASFLSPEAVLLGFDSDEKKIKFARAFDDGRRVTFERKDVSAGLGLSHVSCFLLNDVLHLIPFPEQEPLLRRCFDDLLEGGVLIFKEIDDQPPWKYRWTRIQEYFVNHIFCFTKGKGYYPRTASHLTSILEKIGFKVEVLPAHEKYPYSHIVLICRKA